MEASEGVGENFNPDDLINGTIKENLYTDENGFIKWMQFR